MKKYSIYIAHSGTNVTFNNFDEFKNYLSRYFTPSESSIVDKLTTFKMRTIAAENGYSYKYSENNWRDIKTCCYIFED